MANMIRIEGVDASCAKVDGPEDVFTTADFLLHKPTWVPDKAAATCMCCMVAFGTMRRRHHCRNCGCIFCDKCCSVKVILPQFMLTRAERVCEQCRLVSTNVALAMSTKLSNKITGVQELVQMMYTPPTLRKVLDSGGVQALVCAARLRDEPLRGMACAGFNTLATHTILHTYLLRAGMVKALIRILTESSGQDVLMSGLGVLSVLCKSTQLLHDVQSDGVMEPLLSLIGSASVTVTQMALRVLAQLVEDTQTHAAITASKQGALARIFRCTADQDEQTQEAAFRVLALMALGDDTTRQTIAQEDIFSGHSCQRVLCSWPRNIQVIANATCLVANMAASQQTQGALKDLLLPLCRIIDSHCCHHEVMVHTSRGIANFAQTESHAQLLLPYVINIFGKFVRSDDISVRYQGLRTMISLLTFFPQQTLYVLQPNDVIGLFKVMSERFEVMHSIHKAILEVVPRESKPF